MKYSYICDVINHTLMETSITHVAKSREGLNQFQHGETLCGMGLWNNGRGSVPLVPSFMGRALSVPTCKVCAEALGKMETGRGHQVKADLKKIEGIKATIEAARVELGKSPKFAALAASLDLAIIEAADLSYSIDQALNA